MASNIRKERLENLIREEISALLLRDVTRSSVKKATITDVRLAPDLSQATVFIDSLDRSIVKRLASDLNSMSGYFKTMISKTMTTRKAPLLHFVPDETIDKVKRIEDIIKTLPKEN